MVRRTAEETRELLIETGMQLLHERGPSAAVRHIRLRDVLDRADLTTGAAYRIWDDQDAYQRDLAIAAVRWRDRTSTADTLAAVGPALVAGADWREIVRLGSEVNLWRYPDHMGFLTMLALRASAWGDEQLTAASRERHHEAVAAYGAVYAEVIPAVGRRFRAGFTVQDAAAAMAALSEGFGVQGCTGEPHPRLRLDPRAEGPGEVDWTLLGVCAVAVFEHMTEPATEPDPAGACGQADSAERPSSVGPPAGDD